MLRLAQPSPPGWLALKLHTRRPFWTRRFALALSIAIVLHLLPLGVFRLYHPIQGPLDAPLRLLVTVDIGTPCAPNGLCPTKAQDTTSLLPRQTLQPATPRPSFPRTCTSQSDDLVFQPLPVKAPEAIKVRDISYTPVPIWTLFSVPYAPVTVITSGELSCATLAANDACIASKKRTGPTRQSRTILSVQLEGRSGRLCALELVECSGDSALDHKALDLVAKMRFASCPDNLLIKGRVEVHWELTPDDRQDLLND